MRVIALLGVLLVASSALASEGGEPLKEVRWPFDGVRGSFDHPSVQRGFQVYKEVCSSCHSMKLLSYRNLQEIGFGEKEVKAIAAQKSVTDGPDDAGDMFERPARPSDRFVSPFPNEKAARAANGGALPPDLSLIIKARENGPNYIYSLLTGYQTPPAGETVSEGMYYNLYFPGHQIAMAPPLADGAVEYIDGTPATVDQMSRDVVNFLQWAAEPEMEARKQTGLKVLLFIAVFTVLFYVAKKRVWKDAK